MYPSAACGMYGLPPASYTPMTTAIGSPAVIAPGDGATLI
ncbi:hypothetical protein PLANPX_1163 [Lacipirellula parvula]|uniref:Uncharacterized protein n=1 Tax=Lacipirellula parvula TaxID=2650471 RepID=A0A5K7X9X1_9BACT|nr:hypothetical protein PLANPX_1163 [Lacipirellula parvula]